MSTRTDGRAQAASGGGTRSIELDIGGMTCASCAARIEKKLNRVAGVTATVNYATEKARVTFAGGVTADDLIGVVEQTGYTAALPTPEKPAEGAGEAEAEPAAERDEAAELRHRLLVSLVLMLSLHALTWEVFLIWLVVGLFVYALYSRKHSKVQQELRGVSAD